MLLETVEQSPTELVLAILHKDLPAGLRILREAQITLGEWHVHFRIIGESHAITISHQNRVCLHEVLACIDLSPDDCAHYQPFESLQNHHHTRTLTADAHYAVEVGFEATPRWNTPPITDPMIEFAFPQEGDLTPVTRIHWRITDDAFVWWTLHTYPQSGEVTYVHTRSQVHFE